MFQNLSLTNFSLLFFLFLFLFNGFPPISANTELRALMDIKASLDPDNIYLQTWKVEDNPCSGSFIGVACNQNHQIVNISLQGKGFTGKLSPAVGDLKYISGIYLHYNSIYGKIPSEIGRLNQLTDLYLNVNNFSGFIPPEISHMKSLQVLDLCCNQLTGDIPTQIGSLNKLTVISLEYNQLSNNIPPSLGNLNTLTRLDLSYNRLSGPIPVAIANIQQLQFLDVRNNSLSGAIPTEFKKLETKFLYGNNDDLCGTGFAALRACSAFDNGNVVLNTQPVGMILKNATNSNNEHKSNNFETNCTHSTCSGSKKLPHVMIVVGVVTVSVIIAFAVLLLFFRQRRKKQKVGTTMEISESTQSSDHTTDLHCKSASPLVSLAFSTGWNPLGDGLNSDEFSQHVNQNFRYNMEEIESATGYFSEKNVLSRANFSTIYKGVLRDGSVVAIKSINMTSCKSEEAEFVKGLNLLVSLSHDNLVSLRGFCCSRGRGECFLIYDYARNGNLLKYLDVSNGSSRVLDWFTRVKIITGIGKGLHYLHEETLSKSSLVHQNISAETILLDEKFKPLISDSGIRKILADDTIFSALKVSAAMGYLAPEYITTGRFTEKSDIYAFGVIVLHILSGKQQLTTAMRSAAELCSLEDFIDSNLKGRFSVSEARKMVQLGLSCTHEIPEQRPNMEDVVQELDRRSSF